MLPTVPAADPPTFPPPTDGRAAGLDLGLRGAGPGDRGRPGALAAAGAAPQRPAPGAAALFGCRSVRFGLLVALPVYVASGGFLFVYAFTAGVHGSTPLQIGVSLLPMSLGFLAGSIASGRLVPRFGVGVLTAGAALSAVGFGWLGRLGLVVDGFAPADTITAGPVAGPTIAVGVGIALLWSPLMGVVLSQVPGHLAGLGGGLLLTVMQAGLGFGSAVAGSVFFALGDQHGFLSTALVLAGAMVVVGPLTRLLRPRA